MFWCQRRRCKKVNIISFDKSKWTSVRTQFNGSVDAKKKKKKERNSLCCFHFHTIAYLQDMSLDNFLVFRPHVCGSFLAQTVLTTFHPKVFLDTLICFAFSFCLFVCCCCSKEKKKQITNGTTCNNSQLLCIFWRILLDQNDSATKSLEC